MDNLDSFTLFGIKSLKLLSQNPWLPSLQVVTSIYDARTTLLKSLFFFNNDKIQLKLLKKGKFFITSKFSVLWQNKFVITEFHCTSFDVKMLETSYYEKFKILKHELSDSAFSYQNFSSEYLRMNERRRCAKLVIHWICKIRLIVFDWQMQYAKTFSKLERSHWTTKTIHTHCIRAIIDGYFGRNLFHQFFSSFQIQTSSMSE